MIEIKALNKIFYENTKKEFYALKNINLQINKASCILLKGLSGSGKSTLLSIIGSMQRPTSGAVYYEKEIISKLPDLLASTFRAKHIGFIFQNYNLFDELSVEENVSLPLFVLGLSFNQIEKKVIKALKDANIFDKKEELLRNLSGGEKQRCAIARAMVNDPEIILCDEPTASLDYDNSMIFINTIKELKTLGKTIVIATHDPIFFDLDFVDKIVELKNGMIFE